MTFQISPTFSLKYLNVYSLIYLLMTHTYTLKQLRAARNKSAQSLEMEIK